MFLRLCAVIMRVSRRSGEAGLALVPLAQRRVPGRENARATRIRSKSRVRLPTMLTRKYNHLTLLLTLTMASLPLLSCGPHNSANSANLASHQMPEGAEWKGVYYSQVYGNLHLVEEGGGIKGKWRTTAGEAWGELEGKTQGDLLHYSWTERKIGEVGPFAERHGKGYFRYVRPPHKAVKDPDELHGQWGLGDNDTGNRWDATKQRNMEPDMKSITPDEVERGPAIAGGDWDKSAGESAASPSSSEGEEPKKSGKSGKSGKSEKSDE